jgi:diguanylate cyclase
MPSKFALFSCARKSGVELILVAKGLLQIEFIASFAVAGSLYLNSGLAQDLRMPFRTETVRRGTEVELIRSLYATLSATIIMSIIYVASFGVLTFERRNIILTAFAIAGIFSSAARIGVLLLGKAKANSPTLDIIGARRLEQTFAIAYFQFACLLGFSAAYVFAYEDSARFDMLVICLLVGYGAGVAAGVGLRPWIAIPSMVVAVVPTIVAAVVHGGDSIYYATALATAALLFGGCQSVLRRYRETSSGIGRRLTFEALARRDALTSLPNRLALREWFEDRVAAMHPHRLIAVYCLDLDGFKPINDTFGHPAGDLLLKAVAERVTRSLRSGDIAARLGGDEFAVILHDLENREEAWAMAHRLRRCIAEPFEVRGSQIQISTCVGYVLSEPVHPDLDELLALADNSLYLAKTRGSGVEFDDTLSEIASKRFAA